MTPNQFGRKIGLIVGGSGGQGIDLSQMHIQFRTQQAEESAPNTAYIRIFNLKDSTALQIQNEFQAVSLQAGYVNGNYAQIFNGQIMQIKRGRIDAKDKYLDIMASDGDLFHNFGFVNASLDKSHTGVQNQYQAIINSAAQLGVTGHPDSPNALAAFGGVLPRGKVLFGLGRNRLDDIADRTGSSWFIKDGQVTFVPLTGYLPGQAVVLTAQTGMIGVPEATNQGLEVTSLLNPLIKLGTQVKLDNKSINVTTQRIFGGFYPGYTDFQAFASIATDGVYRVIVAEHAGDIRGNDWETRLVCLALDPSAAPASSVRAY